MLGFIERAFDNVALSIEGAFVKTRCEVVNHLVDVKLRRKLRKYERMRRESGEEVEEEGIEDSEELEELEEPEEHGATSVGMMAKTFISAVVQNSKEKWDNHETEGDS